MIVYPAIDLRGGRVVRLHQGDYERQVTYDADPLELAARYARAGARWLHVVDLDAARAGAFTALDVLRRIATETGMSIQAGGGVRREADVATLLEAGVSRVVVGSVAIREPETTADWLARYGAERLCLALDTRADADGIYRLPAAGWTEATARGLYEQLDWYAARGPFTHLLCTDIARDGMLGGPNIELYGEIARRHPTLAVQASGGVRDVADVRAAFAAGARGAIVGKALLDGRVGIEELLAC